MDWNQVSAKTKLRTTTWNSIPGFAGQLLINTPSISSQNNSDSVFSHCLSVLLDSVSPLQKRFSPRAHFLLGCHQEAQYLVIHREDNFDLTGSCITLPFPFFGSPSTCPFLYILKNQLFAFLLLQYRSSLYFVDINPLWDRRFADIFSCITGCLFILLILSLGAQNFLILTLSSLCTFSFVAYAFSVLSKKILLNPMLWSFSLTFSSKSF